jgi:hypothetical protein
VKSLTEKILRQRIRNWTLFFIAALFVSGISAIPLRPEMRFLVQTFAQHDPPDLIDSWLLRVQAAVNDVSTRWPFLALGTDWLAFGHIVIGLGFIGLLRDPVRNEWLITWGLLACLLVLPWAWCFGWARGIPWGWRLVDCSFGFLGMIPLLEIRRYVNELKRRTAAGVSV